MQHPSTSWYPIVQRIFELFTLLHIGENRWQDPSRRPRAGAGRGSFTRPAFYRLSTPYRLSTGFWSPVALSPAATRGEPETHAKNVVPTDTYNSPFLFQKKPPSSIVETVAKI